MSEPAFIAGDWGTSRLRLYLCDASGHVLARGEGEGAAVPGHAARFAAAVAAWDQAHGKPPALLGGMVGSTVGWKEVPYLNCPARPEALAAAALRFEHEDRAIAIVPGLKCVNRTGAPDVMRGEEVQVFGALALLGLADADATVVLPGTHSKWVEVRGGRVQRFRTCMSGELYALLREHSILGRGVPAPAQAHDPDFWNREAFMHGLQQAQRSNSLLASAFSARSRVLMQQLEATAVPDYLSGLVIGEELRVAHDWMPSDPAQRPLVVVGAAALTERYALALQADGQTVRCVGAEATWQGLMQIARSVPARSG